jgi:hypothetical protein
MEAKKISDLMKIQDEYLNKLIAGGAGRNEIRDALAIMRCKLQTANLGVRHGKASSRIGSGCDYIPEVFFTKEYSVEHHKASTSTSTSSEELPWEKTEESGEKMPWEEDDKDPTVKTKKTKEPK